MDRALLIIEGPLAKSVHCEGCALYEATRKSGDSCPYFGDAYRETEGDNAGLLIRPEECVNNEMRVFQGTRSVSKSFRRWLDSPTRDAMQGTMEALSEHARSRT